MTGKHNLKYQLAVADPAPVDYGLGSPSLGLATTDEGLWA